MPSYIVKISPDEDLYVYWSTVVEAPLSLGSRADLEHYLQTRARNASSELAAADRFARADKTGTSSMDGFYDWNDNRFIVEQSGTVKRSDIPELVRCMGAKADYTHLLTPFEDES